VSARTLKPRRSKARRSSANGSLTITGSRYHFGRDELRHG
jgi:hypothetical protein